MEAISAISDLQKRFNQITQLGASSLVGTNQSIQTLINSPEATRAQLSANPQLFQSQLSNLQNLASPTTSTIDVLKARLEASKSDVSSQSSGLSGLVSDLQDLRGLVRGLRTGDPFKGHSFTVTTDKSSDYASASAQEAFTPEGNYKFHITQLATATTGTGASNTGTANPYSAVTGSSSGFGTAVTAGTFTINDGHKSATITINSTDILGRGISDNTADGISSQSDDLNSKINSLFNYIDGRTSLTKSSVQSKLDDVNKEIADLSTALGSSSSEKGIIDAKSALTTLTAKTASLQTFLDNTTVPTSGSQKGKFTKTTAFSNLVTDITNQNTTVQSESVTNLRNKSVIDKINNSGLDVTASYDPTTDKISLVTTRSGREITLTNGTSNFLQAAHLSGNGTQDTVTSSSDIGALNVTNSLASSRLSKSLTTGTGGALAFKINGVQISANSSESLSTIIDRINNSDAGVTAGYDAANDRFTFTSKTTGATNVSFQDVTGNFLSTTGLSGSTQTVGKNLLGTVTTDSGTTRNISSLDNTFTETDALDNGQAYTGDDYLGLSVTFNKLETTTTSGSTSTKLENAIRVKDLDQNSIRLASSSGYKTGDTVRFGGWLGAAFGLDQNKDYYVKVNNNGKDLQIYRDQASALKGGSGGRVEFNKLQTRFYFPLTGTVARKTTTTTAATTANSLDLTVNISQNADATQASASIQDFVDKYNSIQSEIKSLTSSNGGAPPAGSLADQSPKINSIRSGLRQSIAAVVTGLNGSVTGSGKDGQVTLDSAQLDDTLNTSFDKIRQLFTNRVGSTLDRYLGTLIDPNGSLTTQLASYQTKTNRIDSQITKLDDKLQTEQKKIGANLSSVAQSLIGINKQSQFLSQLVVNLSTPKAPSTASA